MWCECWWHSSPVTVVIRCYLRTIIQFVKLELCEPQLVAITRGHGGPTLQLLMHETKKRYARNSDAMATRPSFSTAVVSSCRSAGRHWMTMFWWNSGMIAVSNHSLVPQNNWLMDGHSPKYGRVIAMAISELTGYFHGIIHSYTVYKWGSVSTYNWYFGP